jgi:LysM repeat protein/ABC-type branched-subunit amino acid transport system substrate-binding protein
MSGTRVCFFKLFIVFLFVHFGQVNIIGQFEPTMVEKATEKVLFQGKVYFLHTVKKGQTLYSICRAYKVTEKDIAQANPDVNLNILSSGQVLKIPTEAKIEENATTFQSSSGDGFIYHTVEPKQTAFSIHQKYNVPIESIYKYNPGSELGLHVGQVIKVPKLFAGETDSVVKFSEPLQGINYTVRQGDTLYNIAKSFRISESDIINANTKLRWGLRTGDIIVIPVTSSGRLIPSGVFNDSVNLAYEVHVFSATECDSLAGVQKKLPIKIALFLPFYASDSFVPDTSQFNDSIDYSANQPKANTYRGIGATEFYEGILLAIDTLKKQGTNLQLYVYDTEDDTNKVKKIIKELGTVQPDLILGPFETDNVRLISQYSQKTGTPFVPPLMKDDTIIKHNPFLFQASPSLYSEIEVSAGYLSRFYNQNYILAYKPGVNSQSDIDYFKKLLKEHTSVLLKSDTLLFTELYIDASFQKKLRQLIRKDKKNIVILLTNQEPEVSNTLSQLYFNHKYFDIEVFGLPVWQKFMNVNVEHMHELQVSLFTPFFIDYQSENVKNFISRCRGVLGYEPFRTNSKGTGMNYVFMGYDLGIYFIKLAKLYGRNASSCLSVYQHEPLMLSDYQFERNKSMGCIENKSVSLIRFNKDFSIEKIKYGFYGY